jgi:hemolysin activation/secretion protein
LLPITCLFAAAGLLAAPDAGSLLRQIERSLPAPELPRVGPEPAAPKVEMPKGKGERLVVRAFRFRGNTALETGVLESALASYLGRELTIEDLKNAAAQVALIYRERGYLAAASIPRQEVKDGEVFVDVSEGWFGSAVVDASSSGRIRREVLVGRVESASASGRPINSYDVDRALLLINDLPGAAVAGAFSAGRLGGQTDVLLVSSATPWVVGSLLTDNSGSRSTGELRGIANVNLNAPAGYGEQYGVDLLNAEGVDYGRVTTSAPIGYSGLKATLKASRMDYRLVSPDFASADVAGSSTTLSAELSSPLVRSRSFNVYGVLGFDRKGYRNTGNGAVTSDYSSQVLTAGLNGNRYDALAGGGTTTASLGVVRGRLALAGSPNASADASGPRAAGDFTKLTYALGRTQTLGAGFSLAATVDGQQALDRNLDSSEKFFVGGPGSVRAYPTSEGGGDSGYVGSLELRYQWAESLQFSVFGEQGAVSVNHDGSFAGATARNDLTYRGYGAGVVWSGPLRSRLALTWAHRLGRNPNPKPGSGNDQDGTLILNRVWASASFQF